MAFASIKNASTPKGARQPLGNEVIDFIAAGVGCHCIVAIEHSGILSRMYDKGGVKHSEISSGVNHTAILAAMKTLVYCGLVEDSDGVYKLTGFGRELYAYRGLVTIFFDGYSDLLSDQGNIASSMSPHASQLIKRSAVAKAAAAISESFIDEVISREVLNSKVKGILCDLGCGTGRMLSKICRDTGNPGLGFEISAEVVEEARSIAPCGEIEIEQADITRLSGSWEEVSALFQCHVFHDFVTSGRLPKILDSYSEHFPNHQYFFYVDTCSPSEDMPALFPGFDYVHGLLGLETPTYQETTSEIEKSCYKIIKEVSLEGLPNTFLWLLMRNIEEL